MSAALKVLLAMGVIGGAAFLVVNRFGDAVVLDWQGIRESVIEVFGGDEAAGSEGKEQEPVHSEEVLGSLLEDTANDEGREGSAYVGMSVPELEEIFIGASVAAYEDKRALGVGSESLQRIAELDPDAAVSLLYSVAPFLKERLAVDMVKGWAMNDPLSAWDWIESAWIDDEGAFVDRVLQNQLSMKALETVLESEGDLILAATLTSLSNQPDLKESLANLVGEYVVSEDPEQALTQFEFEGDQTVDVAIMNAVMKHWAERDLSGAVEWAIGNEDELAVGSMRELSKQLVLAGNPERLRDVFSSIQNSEKRDAVASEAARLLARRDTVGAARWIAEVESPVLKREAAEAALYELGYDDLDATIVLVDLGFEAAESSRKEVLTGALLNWVEQDRAAVARYLALEQEDFLPSSVEAFLAMNMK